MKEKVIFTEKFTNLPVSTRCLYFEFLHNSNEDSICRHPAPILRRGNYSQDDLVLLIERGFALLV